MGLQAFVNGGGWGGPPVSAATFDDSRVNINRFFSFDIGSVANGRCLMAAQLEMRARPRNDFGGEDNDRIILTGFYSSGDAAIHDYSVGFGIDAGPNNYFDFDWRVSKLADPDKGYLINLDLSDFDGQLGQGLNLLPELNANPILDIMSSGDTDFDYADLKLVFDDEILMGSGAC